MVVAFEVVELPLLCATLPSIGVEMAVSLVLNVPKLLELFCRLPSHELWDVADHVDVSSRPKPGMPTPSP